MSFKREGNHNLWLNNLRKRRVNELLACDIPKDEGLLMSNGKYACLVCSYRPVFDTINMLSIHRDGKKHKHYAMVLYNKKQELKELVQKRNHEEICAGRPGNLKVPRNGSDRGGSLLNASAYDPRAKKPRIKPYDRKPVLNLAPSATSEDSLPGSSKHSPHSVMDNGCHPQTISDYVKRRNLSAKAETQPVLPYIKKCRSRDSQMQGKFETQHLNQSVTMGCSVSSIIGPNSPMDSCSSAKVYKKTVVLPSKPATQTRVTDAGLLEKYLKLREAGWKKDWKGNWIKDEDVEFDSDEEPPDLP